MKLDELEHSGIDSLRGHLLELERRVESLERRFEPPAAAPTEEAPAPPSLPSALPNIIQVIGRAFLGLAGAFLLRAVSESAAESGAASRLLAVTVAIVYAAAWLVYAVRIRVKDAVAGATYGVTAALIFAPLLWEATVRFDVLPAAATASILAGFVALVFVLAWPENPRAIASVTTIAAVLTALALMIRTGNLVPFAAALLVVACILETGVWRGHQRNLRSVAAIAADFAIWLMLYIMTSSSARGYAPVSPAIALALCVILFLIYAVSVAGRAAWRRHAITVFETLQLALAFALAAGGALRITQGLAASMIGALCAIGSAACYFTAFAQPANAPRRNHHVFASWGLALSFIACCLILPDSLLTPIWSAAAVVATLAGVRASQSTLGIHGALYLAATALISGVSGSILNAFTGSPLTSAAPALWILAVTSTCCYAAWGRRPAKASVVPALFSAVSMGALLILAGVPIIVGQPTPSLLATARTVVTCALALALRFAGFRTGRRELIWVSYAAIAMGAVKLLLEDFRQSHPAALAVSLVCYGAFLILAPKFAGNRGCGPLKAGQLPTTPLPARIGRS